MNENDSVGKTENQEITVKLSKLTEGVRLVFAGVLTMLEALDASSSKRLLEGFVQTQEPTHHAATEGGNAAPPTEAELPAEAAETPTEPAAPSVTQDDITKIIVQKLKKDRSNNEKIGAILKTYGVAKVSELPAAKYEAFLTDLSQL